MTQTPDHPPTSGPGAPDPARRPIPARRQIRRQVQLPWPRAIRIAWRNIHARLGRSLLVTAGILLAVTFLAHILWSDAILRSVLASGPAELIETLRKEGKTAGIDDADARIQTWWMVTLALLVSLVGVLNAMLLSVTERFSEIGTMKCLGALDSLIVKLVLLESLFQGLTGTLAGLALGIVLCLADGLMDYGGAMWGLLPAGPLLRATGLCLAVGLGLTVLGALYPAWRAARMRPVEAMRIQV